MAVMEVDVSAFKANIAEIRKYLKNTKKLMPVVKANAYGTYLNKRLDVLNDFEIVAVATIAEAEEIRKLGFEKDIFILNQQDSSSLESIEKNNITIGLSSKEFLEEVIRQNRKIKVHLEIETGMGRTGIKLEDLREFIEIIKKNKNIDVQGIYTHFSSADYDLDFTSTQIEKFDKALNISKEYFKELKYIHSQASNGILNAKDDECNLIRPGLIMYGYESFDGAKDKLQLKPVAKLKAKINFVKIVQKGESVSYGRRFIADKETKVATIPIGYADGIRRALSNKGEVVIHGKKAKIIGTICMDSFMVDVTNIPDVKVGDDAYIWDNDIIKLDDLANNCDTINYEILSTIGQRVLREFIN